MGQEFVIALQHNLQPRRFRWLWAKYVRKVNDQRHCTNCLLGWYSKTLSKGNRDLDETPQITLDERPLSTFGAIYICGVYNRGYPKTNYPHNLHAAVLPQEDASDVYTFEQWTLRVRNGIFLPIPSEAALPDQYRGLPPEYTHCRIFRWAVCSFLNVTGTAEQSLATSTH